jgi:hypothetical protein
VKKNLISTPLILLIGSQMFFATSDWLKPITCSWEFLKPRKTSANQSEDVENMRITFILWKWQNGQWNYSKVFIGYFAKKRTNLMLSLQCGCKCRNAYHDSQPEALIVSIWCQWHGAEASKIFSLAGVFGYS